MYDAGNELCVLPVQSCATLRRNLSARCAVACPKRGYLLYRPKKNSHLVFLPKDASIASMEDTRCPNTHTPCAFTKLLPSLKRRARRLSASATDAEDLVQDTMVRVISKQQQGAQIDDLPAYTMRTMHNQARMGWRKQPAPEELNDDDASTPPVAMDRLICADTLRAIEVLPDNQARLLRMVSEGDTSPKVLAERTGWPVGTVMSRLARARIRLKEILDISD